MNDFTNAVERIVAGLEKRNRLLNPKEREIVAYHEMGHALVALALPGTDPVHKVSIIPRGVGALGYTIQRPTEDRFLMTREELENKMAVLLGGRAAELMVFGHLSTGAADDLRKRHRHRAFHGHALRHVGRLGSVAYERDPRNFLAGPDLPTAARAKPDIRGADGRRDRQGECVASCKPPWIARSASCASAATCLNAAPAAP